MDLTPEAIQDLIEIINQVKSRFTDDSEMMWTGYATAKEISDELDHCIDELNSGNLQCVENLKVHFLPTSTFQEHSIQNGWSEAYMQLAGKFDKVYRERMSDQ